jgi:hypothetical protein
MWRKGSLIYCWWESKLVQVTLENSMEPHQKTKNELPYDPGILLLGIYTKECKSGYSKAPAHSYLMQQYSQ